jgi:hypothetical protein
MHLGAKGDHFQHEEHQEGLDPEGKVRSPMDFGEFGDLAKFWMHFMGCIQHMRELYFLFSTTTTIKFKLNFFP